MLYDAHTHLNNPTMYTDWSLYIDRFIAQGGRGLINVGADRVYNENACLIAQSCQKKNSSCVVKATVGFHPYETVKQEEGKIVSLDDIFQCKEEILVAYKKFASCIVAIGEAGIDLHYKGSTEALSLQQKLFAMQCDVAQELHVPLVIHSRDAFDATMEVLQQYPDLVVYFHCRGYGPQEVKRLLGIYPNCFIGFTGTVTYKNAESIRHSLDVTPMSCLLLETDAPYLSPQVVRGQTNEPAFVQYVYDFVASRLDISRELLEKYMKQNFKRFYTI